MAGNGDYAHGVSLSLLSLCPFPKSTDYTTTPRTEYGSGFKKKKYVCWGEFEYDEDIGYSERDGRKLITKKNHFL